MSEKSVQIVKRLAEGLDNVDQNHIVKLVDEFGLYGAGRIMGYDISQYENLLISGRLTIENLKINSPKTLLEYAGCMKELLNTKTYEFIVENHVVLQKAINRNEHRDYDHDWFSANTMVTMYSANIEYGKDGIETPQYTWMRLAIQFYYDSANPVDDVIRAYEEMSIGWYTPSSPTIFNAGMKEPQMSSCFLLAIGDSLESILKHGIYRGGMISKSSGGLGFDISNVRHSEIGGVGWSDGIIPMIQLYNYMVRYVNQRGKRKGAATMYLRPHHIDVEDFIELPRKAGDKYMRAHSLNICLWTSWIFWERVRTNGKWTLFCPAKTPHLNDLNGVEFTKAYLAAEKDPNILSQHKKTINARDLYDKIKSIQRETGMPYLMNGDAANLKSNHRHLGNIRSSNLCLEIVEYTDDKTIAVCNLHSISLRMIGKLPIDRENKDIHDALRKAVDFDQLSHISRRVIANLNKVIDHNWYPLDKVKDGVVKPKIINRSNKRHRPVGMGVSGFAELLHILDLPFEDPIVINLNKMIFACMYWNALAQSIQLAITDGVYESFPGSPTSEGKFQFDLWKEEFDILGPNNARKREDDEPIDPSIWGQSPINLYDASGTIIDTIKPFWGDLSRCMVKYGLHNSLLIALMPTASTAQVRRNCESVEAHQNNLYSRKVLKCSYPVLNRYLVNDLTVHGSWNGATVEYIRIKNGSIQGLAQYISSNPQLFPAFSGNVDRINFLEKKYKTMWEISQKFLMKLTADRCRYVDQSASTNIYIRDCTDEKLGACHLYANMLGLKTIMYYLRQTGGETIKFTADPTMIQHISDHIKDVALDVEKEEKDVENVSEHPEDASVDQVSTKRKYICTDTVCTSCT